MVFLGFFFGQIPVMQENFATTIAGIIVLQNIDPRLRELSEIKEQILNNHAAAEPAATPGGGEYRRRRTEERVAAHTT